MGLFSKLFNSEKAVVANSFVKMPIFNEVLSFPLPENWSIEPTARSVENGLFLLEFQAPQDDNNKLIVQGFNNANGDVELNARKLLKMMQSEMKGLNESAFYSEELFSETVLSQQKIAVIMGLRSLPDDAKQSQFSLYIIIEGKKDIYLVQRSWKGTPNKEGFLVPKAELLAWLEDFKQITLSDLEATTN
jgi:hypothetical protein